MENKKMKTEFAACEFCGQYNTVSVPDNATQEQIRDAAIEVCNCSEAEIQKKKKRQILQAQARVDELFGDNAEKYELPSYPEGHLINYLYKSIEMAANDKFVSVSVNLGEYGKVKISATDNGNISIERTRTVKQKLG